MIEEHDELCVGIDLGTTNSVLAITNVTPGGTIVSKVVDIARYEDIYSSASTDDIKGSTTKKPLLPSCVYYRQSRNGELKPLVGDFAKRLYSMRPQLVSRSVKSQMGQTSISGLSPDVPDKTPEAVSAQILKHMLGEVKRVYHKEITDAIITVPASFDAAMCQATLKAAELAGIRMSNRDGTKRQILLSEPNAVMYDLLNQIQKGEIPAHILDTAKKQKVMVFDIGGGTLDITLHEISRNEKNKELMQMDEIATNRYTRLGGDDFDLLIAQAMFERYRRQYRNTQEIVQKIDFGKDEVIAQLIVYAENMKIDINEQVSNTQEDTWGTDDIVSSTGGRMHNGYAYDDEFTKAEFEQIIAPLLGHGLRYEDYKRLEAIQDDDSVKSIVYPILDVLQKAAKKLKTPEVTVDAVVLNGGMSKLYLIQERLEQFFGFKPILALDPDQAVARGATVYHYYLHKYGETDAALPVNPQNTQTITVASPQTVQAIQGIQLRKTILNDALYLGMSGGNHEMLVDAGTDLPFTSDRKVGFSIAPGQTKIKIPIRKKEGKDTFVTIASGEISFERSYQDQSAVAIRFSLSRNKILSFEAHTDREKGSTIIYIDKSGSTAARSPLIPKQGTALVPKNEISRLSDLCTQRRKNFNKGSNKNTNKTIKICINTISHCGNPGDFAVPIIIELRKQMQQQRRDEFFIQRLLVLGRKLAVHWDAKQQETLTNCCIDIVSVIKHAIIGVTGERVATINEAIRNIGLLGNAEQKAALLSYHNKDKRYEEALIYAHAVSQTETAWIFKQMQETTSGASIWGIGVALQRNGKAQTSLNLQKVAISILDFLESYTLNANNQASALLSLGLVCDQRNTAVDPVDKDFAIHVGERIEQIMQYAEPNKQFRIALQLINGDLLSEEDEAFLLQKITELEERD
ncbi:MAG: Hsp70 family protein [Spirochaetaceae bacterium]|jgi:molecular chaperone DnaK (HSP70)|nr:Hsp70 family protein [Spirochaetaceae bacterium]